MQFTLLCLMVFISGLLSGSEADAWIARIHNDHPRMFINHDLLPLVKKNAEGPLKQHYAATVAKCDGWLTNDSIQFHVYECTLPELMIAFYVSNDQKYKDKALWILKTGATHVRTSFAKKEGGQLVLFRPHRPVYRL